jgi:hypothetical protein
LCLISLNSHASFLQQNIPLSILASETEENPISSKTTKSNIMKRRVRKVANFFAFNLLFFALYLNFIHKDNSSAPGADQTDQLKTAAFSGTVLVENPEQYLQKKNQSAVSVAAEKPAAVKAEQHDATALKLSIN